MLYKEYKTNYKQLMTLKKPLPVLKKISLFLIGGNFYYSFLFAEKYNFGRDPEIDAVGFSAKTLAFVLMGVCLNLFGEDFRHDGMMFLGVFILCMVLSLFLCYLVYIKLNVARYLDIAFEKNISKRLNIIGYLYVIALDVFIFICAFKLWEKA